MVKNNIKCLNLSKKVFVGLLSFRRFLNNKLCMIILTLIDLSHLKPKYYPITINLDKCNWRCNSIDDLSAKICVPNKTKCVKVLNTKVFNMITK